MSSTTGASTKKRKADERAVRLDLMPYGEVRSALLVGKHIAVKAAKLSHRSKQLPPFKAATTVQSSCHRPKQLPPFKAADTVQNG